MRFLAALAVLTLAGFVSLTGCAAHPFETEFAAARAKSLAADTPLGVYEGQWSSRVGHSGAAFSTTTGQARVVIQEAPDKSSLEIWLSLNQFRQMFQTYFPPAKWQTGPGSYVFSAKFAYSDDRAFIVSGREVEGVLTLQYRIVNIADQDVEYEQGTIVAKRFK